MKNRMKKKVEKRKCELLRELFDLVLDINGSGERSQEKTGNLPTAFFDFSGHTGKVKVSIHSRGWNYSYADKIIEAYTDKPGQLTDAVCELKALKAELSRKRGDQR